MFVVTKSILSPSYEARKPGDACADFSLTFLSVLLVLYHC